MKKLIPEFFNGKEPNRSVNSDEAVSLPFVRSRAILSSLRLVLSVSKPWLVDPVKESGVDAFNSLVS